mgnify:CR=1 FL=1
MDITANLYCAFAVLPPCAFLAFLKKTYHDPSCQAHLDSFVAKDGPPEDSPMPLVGQTHRDLFP